MSLDDRALNMEPEPEKKPKKRRSKIETMKSSAIDRDKLREALDFAREYNLKTIEVDGIKMEVPLVEAPVPEADIPQPTTPFDNLSESEILFWSVPHFDELLAAKEERAKALEEEGYVR